MRRIKSLRGLNVALTGKCSEPRAKLTRLIVKSGGHVANGRADVTEQTELLVRGASPVWKHGSFGEKEARAVEQIHFGSDLAIILSDDLDRLLEGHSVTEYPYIAGFEIEVLRSDARLAMQPATEFPKQGELDAPTIGYRRLEQAKLRQLQFGGSDIAECSLCGRRLPTSLMVVGHIKPRARCSAAEKRDLSHVAMPICLIGCDKLFERGFIAVSPSGKIAASSRCRSRDLVKLVSHLKGRRCPAHSDGSEPYFEWHRQNVFQT